jgi:hypothetical protein
MPPHQREDKQQVACKGDDDEEVVVFQNAKRAIKVVYDHSNSDSESSDSECRK